jgi:hypothetical protein
LGNPIVEDAPVNAVSMTLVDCSEVVVREMKLMFVAREAGVDCVEVEELSDALTVRSIHSSLPQSATDGLADVEPVSLSDEQLKDPKVKELREFLEDGKLPRDGERARKIALQASQFALVSGVIYYVNPKTRHKRAVVPGHLRQKMLQETHAGNYSGHFSGRRLYETLMTSWWWEGMYSDAEKFARSCPECIIATGSGRRNKAPLHPIPVQRPFQILGIDIWTCRVQSGATSMWL